MFESCKGTCDIAYGSGRVHLNKQVICTSGRH